MEVDKERFKYNINSIKEYVKIKELMLIIKANVYGTYINKDINILNLFNIIAVAIVDEAKELKKIGYDGEKFVLIQPYKDDIEDYY